MGDAVRDRLPSPDALVQINVQHAPERHTAFLNALADLLATRVLEELAKEQSCDGNDPYTT